MDYFDIHAHIFPPHVAEKVIAQLEGYYGFKWEGSGVYEDLTIVYADQRIPGYTLNVYVNNYPEFPHEGSIRVNKGTTTIDFNNTGVARVELSATGVPVKRGADVIIMLDTSSSMRNNYLNGVSRQEVLTESLSELIAELQRDGEDGEPMDIRVSIADFNNYNELLDKNAVPDPARHFNYRWDDYLQDGIRVPTPVKPFDYDVLIQITPEAYHTLKDKIGRKIMSFMSE